MSKKVFFLDNFEQ
uniref:Uncharacterized protein n=1 Tax=Anguilla anguilla TaxID=7936 RepID=A0A0E9X8T0_ANGAN